VASGPRGTVAGGSRYGVASGPRGTVASGSAGEQVSPRITALPTTRRLA
jgi:hypothetical protein